MTIYEFVSEAKKAPSLAIIAGLTISEWHCLKLYALHSEIPDEKELHSAIKKVLNIGPNNPWREK